MPLPVPGEALAGDSFGPLKETEYKNTEALADISPPINKVDRINFFMVFTVCNLLSTRFFVARFNRVLTVRTNRSRQYDGVKSKRFPKYYLALKANKVLRRNFYGADHSH